MYPSNENSPAVAKDSQSYPEWNNFYAQYNYSSDAYNYSYYNPMYSYSNYVQQQPNYYNAFAPPVHTPSTESTDKINEELIQIQSKVNEKLNYNPSVEKTSEVSSSSESECNVESNKENDDTEKISVANSYPTFFTTQKISNNTSKLSYTVYQLELLNAIYSNMKYPNSVQKTLIAKLIGITRDQVKIWFQNRRRKDTLVSQGKIPSSVVAKTQSLKRRKSGDDFEVDEYSSPSSPDQNKKPVVENEVIENVLYQLKVHQNAPSRLSTKRTKLSSDQEQSYPVKAAQPTEVHNPNRIIDISNIINKDQEVKNDYSSNPSSFVLTSSSSSSSSGISSSEDEVYYQKPAKFQVLEQPFSIQDYVSTNYSYQKMPKVHNQYPQPVYNQVYPQYNKPTWHNNQVPNYPVYQGPYVDQVAANYESQVYDQSSNQYVYNQSNSAQVYNPYATNNLPYSYSS